MISSGIKGHDKTKEQEPRAVNAVLTVTEIKRKCLDMKKKLCHSKGGRLYKPACADIQPIHLIAGNNRSLNE